MRLAHSHWVQRFRTPGILVFATLDMLDSVTRAMLVTVIPVQALATFKDERDVSLVFTLGGIAGFVALFAIPKLIRLIRRRSVFILGILLVIAVCGGLASNTQVGVAAAIFLRTFATSCIVITFSLYVLDTIHKRDFVRLEPARLAAVAVPWTIGPFLGVWLYDEIAPIAPYVFSTASATFVLLYFLWLRLREGSGEGAARPPKTAVASIRRFVVQPRLRLAWLMTFGRSCWWVMFFIYLPLYMVRSGAGEQAGAIIISASSIMLAASPAIGWLARRFRLRPVMFTAFVGCGLASIAAGMTAHDPWLTGGLLLLAALGPVALDSLAPITYYRAVHPYERAEMTTVYITWRDISNLATPALGALVLSFLPLHFVFVAVGLLMFGFAWFTRYVPRSM
ncbi:MAG: MFS transporter [Alphaproteobacteria bacterium]|nr:MFS transporter [Alphaproteobacteria bacterium]